MICKDCHDYCGGKCTAMGEDFVFPVSPEDECVLDYGLEQLTQEANNVRMPFPDMKVGDVKRRWADETGAYFEMKDGTILHSTNGIDWVKAEAEAFSTEADEAEQDEEYLPGDEPEEDEEEFFGKEQDAEKLALCRHIMEMSDGIKRVAPYHIRTKCDDPNDNAQREWSLSLDLQSPTVLLSLPIRKRLCEIMLAADQLVISAMPKENVTRFSFVVNDLWM